MLDDYTRTRCGAYTAQAVKEGRDIWEVLDSRALLLTEDRKRTIEAQAIEALLGQLDLQLDTALAEFGGGQTVTGAVRGVKRFIETYAKGFK